MLKIEDGLKMFLQWEQATFDTIDVKKIYIDMAEDLTAGVLLSQIVYWNLPSKKGGVKLRVKKEGDLWLAKGRDQWFKECRISARQFDRASKLLQDLGLIESKLFKFDGSPTIHIRIQWDIFLRKFHQMLALNKYGVNQDVEGENTELQEILNQVLVKKDEKLGDSGFNETVNSISLNRNSELTGWLDESNEIVSSLTKINTKKKTIKDGRMDAHEITSQTNVEEINQEIYDAIVKNACQVPIGDTFTLEQNPLLQNCIHDALLRNFPLNLLAAGVVEIAAQLFFLSVYDPLNGKPRIIVRDPVGMFVDCYKRALPVFKAEQIRKNNR